MIPYFEQPILDLGIVKLHWFGAMVALGLGVGWNLAQRRAHRLGLDLQVLTSAFYWAVICGFVFAHVLQVLWYRPDTIIKDPLSLLRIWESLSSFGGFVGITVGLILYFRNHRESFFHFGDSYAYGMTLGWAIARLGCTLAHDHPGRPTDFFLAVDYPKGVYGGVARHNLGLYESMITFALFAVIYVLAKKERREGFLMGVLFVSYAIIRFLLDFLRAVDLSHSDPRYFLLTPAQWACFLLFGFGVYCLVRSQQKSTPLLRFATQADALEAAPLVDKNPQKKRKKRKK